MDQVDQRPAEKLLTVSVSDQSCADFLRWVAREADVSVIAEAGLDTRPVTLEVQRQPVSEVLSSLARRLGVELNRTGSLYYLGQLRPEDRGLLVRRVRRLTGEEVQQAVEVLKSDQGKVVAFADGLVVVGDRVEVLGRIHDMCDSIEAAESPSWVVQLYLVSLTDSALDDLGLDVTPAAEVSATFALASMGGGLDSAAALAGGLDAVLSASRERGAVDLVAQPLFLLVDGADAKFSRGSVVPVPTKTVSDQGTVSTNGFEYVEAGLSVECGLREVSAEAARLSVDVSLSDITGYVETAPITAKQSYRSAVVLRSGGVYLVGQLERTKGDHSRAIGLLLGNRSASESGTMQVWARTYRIAGPVAQGDAAAPQPQALGEAMPMQSELPPPALSPTLVGDRYSR